MCLLFSRCIVATIVIKGVIYINLKKRDSGI